MFEVRDQAEGVDILLYDSIGERTDPWTGEKRGIGAVAFKEALDAASPRPVNLRIDSGGGDVFEAFAMCSAIQRYEGKVTAYVDGLAASAASYIAAVCEEVVMNDYAYIMIHCAQSVVVGNARDMEDVAARLRNIDDNLAGIYEKRSNLTHEQVIAYMEDETWFTAADALECGLCTSVVETEERMAACVDAEIAAAYKHRPEAVEIRRETAPEQAPEPEPATVEDAESHAGANIAEEAVRKAAYTLLDGKIYRKDGQNE